MFMMLFWGYIYIPPSPLTGMYEYDGTGRQMRLKILWGKPRASSNLATRIINIMD